MKIKSIRLVTLSFFVVVLLVLVVSVGRDQNVETPARDPSPSPVPDANPQTMPNVHRAPPNDQCGRFQAGPRYIGDRNAPETLGDHP